MQNKLKNIFKLLFLISGIIGFILGFLLFYFSLYDTFNLIGIGKFLYELIFGPLYIGTYYMQRVPAYIMGLFYILYAILSIITIKLITKKNKLTRGVGMTSCTVGLVAILFSRPMRYEIFYIVAIIFLFQLSVLIISWNKLLFEEELNEI